MTDLRAELFEVIDRRQSDMAIAKRSIFLSRTEKQKNVLLRSCTLLIYASLEGGCKELTSCLLSRIDKTQPSISDLASPFLFLAIGRSCRIAEVVLDLQKKAQACGASARRGLWNSENARGFRHGVQSHSEGVNEDVPVANDKLSIG